MGQGGGFSGSSPMVGIDHVSLYSRSGGKFKYDSDKIKSFFVQTVSLKKWKYVNNPTNCNIEIAMQFIVFYFKIYCENHHMCITYTI